MKVCAKKKPFLTQQLSYPSVNISYKVVVLKILHCTSLSRLHNVKYNRKTSAGVVGIYGEVDEKQQASCTGK